MTLNLCLRKGSLRAGEDFAKSERLIRYLAQNYHSNLLTQLALAPFGTRFLTMVPAAYLKLSKGNSKERCPDLQGLKESEGSSYPRCFQLDCAEI